MTNKTEEIQLIDELTDFLLPEVIEHTVIEGGNYLLEEKDGIIKHLVNFKSSLTFRIATALFQKARQTMPVTLTFIIGDLGVDHQKRKLFNEQFQFPQEYLRIMEERKIRPSEIRLFFESNLRNKAARKIKLAIKNNEVVENDERYRMNIEKFGIFCDDEISSKNLEKDKRVPICRMIIAQEHLDKEFLGFKKAINICNLDVYKCTGRFASVYQSLLRGKMEVINVYLFNEGNNIKVLGDRYKSQQEPERFLTKDYKVTN